MEKRSKITFVIFWMIVITTALIVTINYGFFKYEINKYIFQYGYLGVFVFGFLADVLEQPIAADIPASVGVIFGLNLYLALSLAIIASFFASSLNYSIGKRFLGEKIKTSCRLGPSSRLCKLYNKYGRLELTIAAISPVPWVSSCYMFGAFQMNYKNFITYGVIPRTIRIIAIVLFLGSVF
ncbi:MAG: VTT domain-containing protein [Candidatus Pacearchaeota archaeon]